MKSILFMGLGSAGQRHLRNICKLFPDKYEILAYRSTGNSEVYNDRLEVVPGVDIKEAYPVKEYYSLTEALDRKPDIVFICNPNNMHISSIEKAMKIGASIFVEKPLSNSMEGIADLISKAENYDGLINIGFQYRFHPCIKQIKELMDSGQLGEVLDVYAEVGELLTSMHKYQDYRTMIEARKDLGGGVVSCQVHEIDYVMYLMGIPAKVYSVGGARGDFDMDVEGVATSVFSYERDGYCVSAVIHQDYFQFPPKRNCRIVFEKATVCADLMNNSMVINYRDGRKKEWEYSEFERNDMFIEEIKAFLEAVEHHDLPRVVLDEGVQRIKVVELIKKSMKQGRVFDYEG